MLLGSVAIHRAVQVGGKAEDGDRQGCSTVENADWPGKLCSEIMEAL